MNRQQTSGFTIIETMLFLAISSLLAVMVLVGAGVNIDRQRYRDTANSLKSYLQEQYSQAANINNIRGSSTGCALNGSRLEIGPTAGITWPRGADDSCVILGRYVKSDDGVTLTSGPVIGMRTGNIAAAGWRDVLQNYARAYSPTGRESYEVAWGNKVSDPFNLMFVRSPQDGAMHIIVMSSGASTLEPGGAITGPGVRPVTLCLEGEPAGMKRTGVYIPADASSQSGIQVMTDTSSTCA